MQAYTHILFSVLLVEIFRTIFPAAPLWVQLIVVIPLSLAGHFFIDASAIITYHPPKADWKDWFWVTYHVLVYAGTVVVLIFFLVDYWWAIIAGTLPDLVDWLILRFIFKKDPVFHPLIDKLRSVMYKRSPNWNHKRWTVIIEYAIVGVLLTLILVLRNI